MYICGWTPRPALILGPIEHFDILLNRQLKTPTENFTNIAVNLKLQDADQLERIKADPRTGYAVGLDRK